VCERITHLLARSSIVCFQQEEWKAMADRETLRRQPHQDRSRERVDTILQVSRRLIGEKGIAAVAMKEIASECEMPLATVYYYFPDRSAIIATLYQRFCTEIWAQLKDVLESFNNCNGILTAFESVVDNLYARLKADPEIQDLLNAVHTDKALRNIDIEVTREQASYFYEMTAEQIAARHRQDYYRHICLVFQLAGETIRLALTTEREDSEKTVSDFKQLVRVRQARFDKAEI
jgi:AcrR family transcriptional regulator